MDDELRALERAAAEGDEQAGAKLLLERARRGEIAREGIELAARLGDRAAALAAPPTRRSLSADFRARHAARIATIHDRALDFLERGWEPRETGTVLGVLAALAGHEDLAERIFALENVTCNSCPARFDALA